MGPEDESKWEDRKIWEQEREPKEMSEEDIYLEKCDIAYDDNR